MTDFSALYKKYAPDVFRFAMYLSGNRSEAEDITSETFVRAWTAPGPIAMATVKGYLLTIARPAAHATHDDPATLAVRPRHGVLGDRSGLGGFVPSPQVPPSAAGLSGAAWVMSSGWS